MTTFGKFASLLRQVFLTPVATIQHWGLIIAVGLLYIFVPQHAPIDWDLITKHLWSDGFNLYQNPGNVYPPWGMILIFPYYLIRASGARIFSVIVIGWLTHRRGWSLGKFALVVFGPYFLVTLSKSNMDIFVFVLPFLLWESSERTRWQSLGRGLALSIYLLKPQGAILVWIYLLWTNRKNWREMILPLLIVAMIVVPISFMGSPPLILQWVKNLLNPPPDFEYYWSTNNMSLSNYLSLLPAIVLLIVSYIALRSIMSWNGNKWSRDHTISSLILVSMFLSPYTSQQSFSSGLAFIPSAGSFIFQLVILIVSFSFFDYVAHAPLWVFAIAMISLFFYRANPSGNIDQDAI